MNLRTLERTQRAKYFYLFFFVIGLVITIFLGVLPCCSFFNAPSYSFQPSFSGFAVARNHTNITPDRLRVIIGIEPATLFFQYSFACYENGTYNFLFIFPFNVTSKINSTQNMNFTATSVGSAIWLQYPLNDVPQGGSHRDIFGDFLIENTFQSGTRGSYTFILPFGGAIKSEVIGNRQSGLGVFFHTEKVELEFTVPETFRIIQSFPGFLEGPEPFVTSTNRTMMSVKWIFDELRGSVTIYCEDPNERSSYESWLFLGGIFLSLGMSITVTTIYDFFKERTRPSEKKT